MCLTVKNCIKEEIINKTYKTSQIKLGISRKPAQQIYKLIEWGNYNSKLIKYSKPSPVNTRLNSEIIFYSYRK